MSRSQIIFIRADANSHIASGHMMRCLTIASALRRKGHQATFLISDKDSEAVLTSRGESSFVCLHSNYQNLEEELPLLLPLLYEKKPDCFLLDSYFASPSYMQAVKSCCKLVYLDDLQSFAYPAHLIINYDLTANAAMYGNTPSLTGVSYTPLREQFKGVPYQVREQVKNLLISTGGSDNHHAASQIFHAVIGHKDFAPYLHTCHILTGSMNPHKEALYRLSEDYPQITVHENITEMAALLSSCDLAFSAGGTTLFELCSVGVPTVSFSLSDEQFPCVHAFEEEGLIPYAGDVRAGNLFVENLLKEGTRLAKEPAYRRELSSLMRRFVDGNGADRIAEALTNDL